MSEHPHDNSHYYPHQQHTLQHIQYANNHDAGFVIPPPASNQYYAVNTMHHGTLDVGVGVLTAAPDLDLNLDLDLVLEDELPAHLQQQQQQFQQPDVGDDPALYHQYAQMQQQQHIPSTHPYVDGPPALGTQYDLYHAHASDAAGTAYYDDEPEVAPLGYDPDNPTAHHAPPSSVVQSQVPPPPHSNLGGAPRPSSSSSYPPDNLVPTLDQPPPPPPPSSSQHAFVVDAQPYSSSQNQAYGTHPARPSYHHSTANDIGQAAAYYPHVEGPSSNTSATTSTSTDYPARQVQMLPMDGSGPSTAAFAYPLSDGYHTSTVDGSYSGGCGSSGVMGGMGASCSSGAMVYCPQVRQNGQLSCLSPVTIKPTLYAPE